MKELVWRIRYTKCYRNLTGLSFMYCWKSSGEEIANIDWRNSFPRLAAQETAEAGDDGYCSY